ncbi:MAG: hypothetical protein CL607_16365 [Anaerolineaceae bacterium]|nr:hypothetical protein [Anaerolineaceae bacterium]
MDAHQWKELVAVADGIPHILFGLARFDEALKLYISTRQHLKNVQTIPDDLLIRLDIYDVLATHMTSQKFQFCEQNLKAVEQIFSSKRLQDYLYELMHCVPPWSQVRIVVISCLMNSVPNSKPGLCRP